MSVLGPKLIASTFHFVVKVAFILAAAGALIMIVAPALPSGWLQFLSFDLRSGPLYVSFPVFEGAAARWWIWAMELVSRVCRASVLYLLMRILEPIQVGEPFHREMPKRLRWIAFVIVFGSLLRTFFCAALLNASRVATAELRISWAIDIDAIFVGIVLLVLAEVFRRGYALRTESELTI